MTDVEKAEASEMSEIEAKEDDELKRLSECGEDVPPSKRRMRGSIRLSFLKTLRECFSASKVVYASVLILLLIVYEIIREILRALPGGDIDLEAFQFREAICGNDTSGCQGRQVKANMTNGEFVKLLFRFFKERAAKML